MESKSSNIDIFLLRSVRRRQPQEAAQSLNTAFSN